MSILLKSAILFLVSLSAGAMADGQKNSRGTTGKSEWVSMNSAGKLIYKKTERGERVMDFSHAGYMGGGVALPEVPVKMTLSPSGSDDTEIIQSAINRVSAMPLEGEFRGAVLLLPGVYNITGPIIINHSGIVLRGSGSGMKGRVRSTILMKGTPFNAITIRSGSASGNTGSQDRIVARTSITDKYVPSGSDEFRVADATQLKAGDVILIKKPVTEKWIRFMQMDDLIRDGKPQTWIKTGTFLISERIIKKVDGSKIMVDVPLSDSYDADYTEPGGTIVELAGFSGRLKQCGVEKLNICSPPQAIPHSEPHFTALRINGEDCWAHDMLIEETMNSIGVGGKRITVSEVTVSREALHQGSSRPAEFAPNGSQVLIDRCKVIADNVWFVATGSGVPGPIVILNCEFTGDQRAESHQRWSTGMLYDNVKAENGGIDFRNRGSMGSGHGWSMGWGVAWNCKAKDFVIQNPPGVCNWMIGCIGESKLMPRPFDKEPVLEEGIKDSHGVHVAPQSLYLAQLKERLGKKAIKNIGY